ncbi:ATP-binding protein [Streptomyces silvensis]|uniref:Nephrocystin 3-like N-terminal domain-containing protein n=1 Tax=Streptomyces silvensis TaxID=1765722 RepID=A0A0W7X3J2_9ACTN|nr:ATP-binding protein [Streptomyces silvensis]KUF17307.1 hypothetical protein AT728_15955 [Streptomyces silvensis]
MSDLKALYEAAGGHSKLGYTKLIRDATASGITLTKPTLTAWLNKNPPVKREYVEYVMKRLIPDLQEKAASRSPHYHQIPEASWAARLAATQKVSQSNKGGHGPRVGAASRGRLLRGASQALLDVLPVDFVGRDEELDSLENFVTASKGSPNYLWLQAGPWAGKTALLSWFIARRLPAGVDVAHYFIAGRLGTDRRDGFVRAVTKQLAAAVDGKWRPRIDLEQPNLVPLYEAAAQACADSHRRLVLIVDGLDEDADAGPGSVGIAGLLPKDPPCGMRVIVAGRPHPRVPQLLATDHPLRTPAIVRPLTESPDARVVRDAALTELRALLTDPSLGQHLLGLLVTARGALTGADLAELAGVTPSEVRDKLSGVTSRSLVPTRIDLLPLDVRTEAEAAAGRQTFVLAHQELYDTAHQELGRSFRATYTTALHDWARRYSDEGWPHDTPNYLLTGYARLLHAQGDAERLTALAIDARRQLRLLHRSGPDIALLHLDLAASAHTARVPPLGTTAAIAASREMLLPHVRPLPPAVAQTLARLGDAPRARALVSSAGRAVDKALNLAGVARVLRTMGDTQAAATAQEAARCAHQALREAGRFGDSVDEAEGAAGQAALALLETALPATDSPTHEVNVPRRSAAEYWAAPADTVRAGSSSRARQNLLDEALALLRRTRGVGTARLEAWAQAARLLAADHPEQADELLDTLEEQAETLACDDPAETDSATCAIQLWQTVACAAPDRAERLVDRILTHAHEVFTGAPTLENVATLAIAAQCAAPSRPEPAARLVSAACRHLEHVLGPDSVPMTPADTFHVEFGFRHTLALLKQALSDIGAPPDQITHVRQLADRHLPAEPQERAEQPSSAEDELAKQSRELFGTALRLAENATSDEAEHYLEQGLALQPTSIPGSGRSPMWLPDLAAALIRADTSTDIQPLTDLAQHPADRVRFHAALALAYSDTHHLATARRHAQEAAHAATTSHHWPFAAQALASAGEVQAAVRLIEKHPQPRRAAARAAWRTTDRAVRVAVATELSTHAPDEAGELLLPLLKRLDATSHAVRSTGLLSPLAGILPAAEHLPPAPRELLETLLERARDQSSRHSPHSWHPEDVLVRAFLRVKAGEYPEWELTWLTQDLTGRGPEHFPTPALAVLHATLGDSHTALRVANQPTGPLLRASALTAVATHWARLPAHPHPVSDPTTKTHFTRAIQHLAQSASSATPHPEASAKALHHVLTTPVWHHAIQILYKLAPEAITAIRAIALTHLDEPARRNSAEPRHGIDGEHRLL